MLGNIGTQVVLSTKFKDISGVDVGEPRLNPITLFVRRGEVADDVVGEIECTCSGAMTSGRCYSPFKIRSAHPFSAHLRTKLTEALPE
jgi:hypothetical protein